MWSLRLWGASSETDLKEVRFFVFHRVLQNIKKEVGIKGFKFKMLKVSVRNVSMKRH